MTQSDTREREIPDPKKAEAGRKGSLKRQDNWRRGVKECEWCGKLSADLNEHPCFIAADSAATAMRDACIEKVKGIEEPHLGEISKADMIRLFRERVIDELKSIELCPLEPMR